MNFNIEFPTFYLRQWRFLHPWKSHVQNDRSDSTPRLLTLLEGIQNKEIQS